jgi:hypothetical protein
MNVESLESNRKVRTVGPKGKKDPRSLRCFYCGILGHVKAGCPVRIYRLERSEKRGAGSERAGTERNRDDKEEPTLLDIGAMSAERQRQWEEVFMSWGRLLEDLQTGCSDEAKING